MKAIINAHFLPGDHFDALVKGLKDGSGYEVVNYDEYLKLIFIRKIDKEGVERIKKIACKYEQAVEFY